MFLGNVALGGKITLLLTAAIFVISFIVATGGIMSLSVGWIALDVCTGCMECALEVTIFVEGRPSGIVELPIPKLSEFDNSINALEIALELTFSVVVCISGLCILNVIFGRDLVDTDGAMEFAFWDSTVPVKLGDFAEFARMVLEVLGAAFSVVSFILLNEDVDNGGRAKLVVSSLSKTPISGILVVVSILGAVGSICDKTVV